MLQETGESLGADDERSMTYLLINMDTRKFCFEHVQSAGLIKKCAVRAFSRLNLNAAEKRWICT